MALNSQAYESDDINFQEMKNCFDNRILSEDEYILLNLQLLEVLKAYDITRKTNLLEYSKYLSKILLKHETDSPIDNKSEANILIKTIDAKSLEEFRKYPIAIYI